MSMTATCWTRRLLDRGPLVHAVVLVCMMATLFSTPAFTQNDRPFRIKKIYVPFDKPQLWLKDDLETVTIKEFKRLLTAAKSSSQEKASTIIPLAEYTASFDAARNTISGSLLWQIEQTKNAAKFLRLDPIALAISKLDWGDEPAIWGTDKNGQVQLLINRNVDTINGNWSLTGRPRIKGTEFQLNMPPAVISKLRLLLPDQYVLESSVGEIIGPVRSGRKDWQLWEVNLGSLTSTRLRVRKADVPLRSTVSATLYERQTTFAFRESDLEMVTRINADVLNISRKEFDLLISDNLEIQSISYGANNSIDWRRNADSGNSIQRITVTLPTALTGKAEQISISATAPVELGHALKLPSIQLANGIFIHGEMRLTVEAPLVLRDISGRGIRQLASVSAEGIETQEFDELTPSSSVTVNVEYPRQSVSVKSLTVIDTTSPSWSLRSETRWTDRSGLTYASRCRVASDWKITDVRAKSSSTESRLANWDVSETDDNQSILELDFKDALSPDSPQVIEIVAQRRSVTAVQRTNLPIIEFLDCDEVDQVSAIVHSKSVKLSLATVSHLDQIELAESEREWSTTQLYQRLLETPVDEYAFFRGRGLTPSTQVTLQSLTPQLDVVANTNLRVLGDEVVRSMSIQCQPRLEAVDHILVYFPKPHPEVDWTFASRDGVDAKIAARRISGARHVQLGLPRTGELWDLTLPMPVTQSFMVMGVSRQPASELTDVVLPFAPQVASFEADVSLQVARNMAVNVDQSSVFSAKELTVVDQADSELVTQGEWQYESVPTGFQLRIPEMHPKKNDLQSVILRLRSRVSTEQNGWDSHAAEFLKVDGTRFQRFHFQLPKSAVLLGVTSSNTTLKTLREGKSYSIVTDVDELLDHVIVHYRTSSASAFLESNHAIAYPQIPYDIRMMEWSVSHPNGMRIVVEPQPDDIQYSAPDISWWQRMFGPLGRRAGQRPFMPFRMDDWASVVAKQQTESTNLQESRLEFHAKFRDVPDQLELKCYNLTGINLLSWSATLVVVAATLTVRLLRWRFRIVLGFLFALIGIGTIAVVPQIYSQLAGACLVAILLGSLVPRQFLVRSATPVIKDASSPSLKTTISLHNVTAVFLFAAISMTTSNVLCQDETASPPAATNQDGTTVPTYELLVPVISDEGQLQIPTEAPFVHPTKKLLEHLRSRVNPNAAQITYLMSDAQYSLRISDRSSATLTATYRVSTFFDDRPTEVSLPIDNVNLSGDVACTIDGKAVDIKPMPPAMGSGYVVKIPTTVSDETNSQSDVPPPPTPTPKIPPLRSKIHVIELRLHPIVKSIASDAGVNVAIPEVCASRLRLDTAEGTKIDSLNDREFQQIVGPSDNSVILGRSSAIDLTWSQSGSASSANSISAEVSTWVEATKRYLRYRCRTRFSLDERQTASRFALQIPNDAILVTAETQSPSDHAVTTNANGNSELVFDFDQPQTGIVFVEYEFIRQIEADKGNLVDIPSLQPLTDGFEIKRHELGIVPGMGFSLRTTPNSLETITPDDFLKQWDESSNSRRPNIGFKIVEPITVGVELLPLASSIRVIAQTQVGRIFRDRLEWSTSLEVETSSASVFQYRLSIDPRLKIKSVQVFDEAERLERFARVNNQLILFLKDRASNIQNIVVQSSMPLTSRRSTTIPFIRLDGTDEIGVTTSLYRAPELDVDLTGSGIESNSTQSTELTKELSLISSFESPPDADLASFRINPAKKDIHGESVVVVSPRENGKIAMRTSYVLNDVDSANSNIQLTIPKELATNHTVRISAASYQESTSPDGETVIKIVPPDSNLDRLDVTVESFIDWEADTPAQLPLVQIVGVNLNKQLVVIKSNELIRITNSNLTKAEDNELPDWFDGLPDETNEGLQIVVLRSDESTEVLDLSIESVVGARHAEIVLSDTRINWTSRNDEFGDTRLYVAGQLKQPTTIKMPDQVEVRKVYVNDVPQQYQISEDGQLSIDLPDVRQVTVILVQWTRRHQWNRYEVVRRIPIVVPTPIGVPVLRQIISTTTSDDTVFFSESIFSRVTRNDLAVDWLEGIVEFNEELVREIGQPDVMTWHLANLELNRLDAALANRVRGRNPVNDILAERLTLLSQRMTALTANADFDESIKNARIGLAVAPSFVSDYQKRQHKTQSPETDKIATHWIVDWVLIRTVIAGLMACVGLLLARRMGRSQLGEFLARHTSLAWFLLGAFWWLCLTPSVLGIFVMLFAVIHAARSRTTNRISAIEA